MYLIYNFKIFFRYRVKKIIFILESLEADSHIYVKKYNTGISDQEHI